MMMRTWSRTALTADWPTADNAARVVRTATGGRLLATVFGDLLIPPHGLFEPSTSAFNHTLYAQVPYGISRTLVQSGRAKKSAQDVPYSSPASYRRWDQLKSEYHLR
jgi:hypothetical protein